MGAICCAEGRKGEADTEGLSTSQLRKAVVHNTGIAKDDIFGDQMNDIDETQDDIDSIYKNRFEENLKINSTNLLDFYERLRLQESDYGKYDSKVNEEKLKILFRTKGSELCQDVPVIWSQYMFEKGITVPMILKAIHNPEERVKWDKDLRSAEVPRMENENSMMVWHQQTKSTIKYILTRDFLEKKIKFTTGNKKYVYFSSLPDEILAAADGESRAYTVFGFHVFERQEDGRILMEVITQTDYNVGVGALAKIAQSAVVSSFPKTPKPHAIYIHMWK
ncbi:UNKNOWN [Stylonychia lemnae]|uniref:START domain-containing protein n=1 Tax=Stylonychia lemnae TaxID=5949 RepID=A0A078A4Z4_STYLE|nr:UNKNOWN [Stylonychia lemnae]|eukprot:CDW77335.1 UNKNOWN [Stylonychia lemnae]